jgi:uncharacterized protein (TIGR02265 family)
VPDRILNETNAGSPAVFPELVLGVGAGELRWHVDLDTYLAACPPRATTRGTFFTHLRERVREKLGEVPADLLSGLSQVDWRELRSYPLADFMRLAYRAARLLYPATASSEGLRRVGRLAYPSFASTTTGRIVLFALGHELEDVAKACATAYRVTLPDAVVRVLPVSEPPSEAASRRRYRVEMRSVYSFVDTYHYGALEGAALALGRNPTVTVRRLGRSCDADFDCVYDAPPRAKPPTPRGGPPTV